MSKKKKYPRQPRGYWEDGFEPVFTDEDELTAPYWEDAPDEFPSEPFESPKPKQEPTKAPARSEEPTANEQPAATAVELHERIGALIGADLYVLSIELSGKMEAYLRAKAMVEHLDRMRSVVRAKIKENIRLEMAKANEKVSEARLVDLAKSNRDYIEFLAEEHKVEGDFALKLAEYTQAKNDLDLAKTALMFAQTEMRTMG